MDYAKIRVGTIILLLVLNTIGYAQSINQVKVDTLLKYAERSNSEAVIIYKDNKLVAEKYFGIGKPKQKIETMSCTKSIVGLAVACMLSDGLIDSLDVPVSNYYPEWKQGQKKDITIRHLVNMTSGMQNVPNTTIEIYPAPDFVQLALTAELDNKPGEVFNYNNKSLNLMAGVIKKITGKRMDAYIGERLFKPLGIKDFGWSLDNAGNPHVMSGCQITPSDFIKIGMLVLNKGKYNTVQVIAEKFIQELVKPCKQFDGYGMLWWIDYELTTGVIDDEIIAELTKANVSPVFMDKFSKMKGAYASFEEFGQKLNSIFGTEGMKEISENIQARNLSYVKVVKSGNITYRAEGYLGNYLIVDPNSNIVAVRMISEKSFRDENDGFFAFGKLVSEITK